MYGLLRHALFSLEPERAHAAALSALQLVARARLVNRRFDAHPINCMGLCFLNRVGLAAGFDKNGRYIDAIARLGFGFIEIGTVTPRPQSGQPLPRVFRLPTQGALINRMGFPNEGAPAVAARLRARRAQGVVGINIGKNAATPLNRAIDDYVDCYRTLVPVAGYVVINVSSPNTLALRSLQQVDHLKPIVEALLQERRSLPGVEMRSTPLLVKISADEDELTLVSIAKLAVELGLDGIVATNTTVSRFASGNEREAILSREPGGLSGTPLHAMSVRTIATLKRVVGQSVAIIGVGGIASVDDAIATLRAGADLLQVYTGLIYRGPRLIKELVAHLNTPLVSN